ncbi:hypothetical protein OUZ56_029168 [Daphnia magna]|uniref:Secreted protein n=1 Tax=Daphnia magna TaxID=35525 RepID=A0ABR0B612_9CRUS|nr:hypothetical protein OUZ56_029168 [Daphnia magna]
MGNIVKHLVWVYGNGGFLFLFLFLQAPNSNNIAARRILRKTAISARKCCNTENVKCHPPPRSSLLKDFIPIKLVGKRRFNTRGLPRPPRHRDKDADAPADCFALGPARRRYFPPHLREERVILTKSITPGTARRSQN